MKEEFQKKLEKKCNSILDILKNESKEVIISEFLVGENNG